MATLCLNFSSVGRMNCRFLTSDTRKITNINIPSPMSAIGVVSSETNGTETVENYSKEAIFPALFVTRTVLKWKEFLCVSWVC